MRPAGFKDRAVPQHLARLSDGRSKPDVFGQLGFICEPPWVEYLGGELSGNDWSDARMSSEQFTDFRVRFFTECLFDSLFGEFALLDNEGKFIEQYIEAVSQLFRKTDFFKVFDGGCRPA